MINKKEMTEEEIKLNYITPAITRTWSKSSIRMEFSITLGRIIIDGKKTRRSEKGIADYILFHNDSGEWFPLAVVEAKDNNHSVIGGMGQAMKYAKAIDAPFAFSSNGDAFAMFDFLTGKETDAPNYISMDNFPSPEELWEKYKIESGITEAAEKMLSVPYYYRENMHEPRYYQWIAVNRVLEAVANGKRRALIVLATGTGKTLVAFQIIWRLLEAKKVKRVLFLADRDILVSQPMQGDFSPFGNKMTRITNRIMDTTHEVYLSLYHQMKNGEENYYTAYDKDFFDLVIVDECHRGSADDNSSWREILEYFKSAIQIGMTATPKETDNTSNIEYFSDGEEEKPLYTYSLKQGIEDGFLAPYKVIRVNLDIDINGFRPYPGMKDIYGEELEDRLYEQKDFDRVLVIPERTRAVAKRISDFLKETDRFAKTIIFCEDISHAERMKTAIINENSDLVVEYPYVAQITARSPELELLDDFTDPHEKIPVIAITSRLMSTGVNTQTCKVVALDRTVNSMTEFKQIIGRGTRVREDCDKMYFTIMDFRKNYIKFADPAFDGEPVKIKDISESDDFNEGDEETEHTDGDDFPYDTGDKDYKDDGEEKYPLAKPKKYIIRGVSVRVINEVVEYLDANGNLITQSIIEYSRTNLRQKYPYFEEFQKVWLAQKNKNELLNKLVEDGVFIDFVKDTLHKGNIDDYDVLSYIGYNKEPLTKEERIERILSSGYLEKFSEENQDIIKLLLEAYKEKDIDELTNILVLKMPKFIQIGSLISIVNGFGGKEKYNEMLNEIENILYAA
ncbi:MAG: DEAD/DEAH box helicase family protein [Selenomonadaceae bacterium]|nr:DEAD/DEAH box helicase family protein [Selenomonadaceae bacterium]